MSRTHLLSAVSFGVISRCVPFFMKLVLIIAFVFTVSFNKLFMFLRVFKFQLCHHMSFLQVTVNLNDKCITMTSHQGVWLWFFSPSVATHKRSVRRFIYEFKLSHWFCYVKLHQHSFNNNVNSSSYQLNHIIIRILSLNKIIYKTKECIYEVRRPTWIFG